jgi:hypothetical protein
MKGGTTIGGAGDAGCGCWEGGDGKGREGVKWMFSAHACIAGESNRIGNKETKTHGDLEDEYR